MWGKIRDGYVKKSRGNGTYHPWKPKVESSKDLNLQHLGHKTEKNVDAKKFGSKRKYFKITFGLGCSNGLILEGPVQQCMGNNISAYGQVIICRKVGKGEKMR